MIQWPDLKLPPVNLWVLVPAKDFYKMKIPYVATVLYDNKTEIIKGDFDLDIEKEYLDKLISDHWDYIKGVLEHDGLSQDAIRRIEYHYKTAFEHGWKHHKEYIE